MWKKLAKTIGKLICDEIIGVNETNFNEKNITYETQNLYNLLTLLIDVSIYNCLVKYRKNKNIYYHFATQN